MLEDENCFRRVLMNIKECMKRSVRYVRAPEPKNGDVPECYQKYMTVYFWYYIIKHCSASSSICGRQVFISIYGPHLLCLRFEALLQTVPVGFESRGQDVDRAENHTSRRGESEIGKSATVYMSGPDGPKGEVKIWVLSVHDILSCRCSIELP